MRGMSVISRVDCIYLIFSALYHLNDKIGKSFGSEVFTKERN